MRTARSLPYRGLSVQGVSVWGLSVRETSSLCEQVDDCENITLPQTSFADGNKLSLVYLDLLLPANEVPWR